MPWDCTLAIIRVAKTHDLSHDPAKNARRLRRGDICDAYLTSDVATIDGNGDYRMNGGVSSPVYGFVHVTNIPDKFTFEKIKALANESIPDPLAPADKPIHLRRKAWNVSPADLPAALKTKFQTEKEITVGFAAVRNYMRKKFVASRDDATTDMDAATTVQDSDLQ